MSEEAVRGPGDERRQQDPQSLRLRLHSFALTVDDLERSLRFYVDGLGFTVTERWEEEGRLLGVMLVAGTCHLGLSQDDWAKGRDRTKGVGFRVFTETTQDLDAFAAQCRSRGLVVEGPTEQWGMRMVMLSDPDGFKLTIAAAG
jgi:lactoylglutathione lyase